MKELTDLPIYDIWPLIFSNLSISDLFNCRLVSKKFKEFSDHTNGIEKLIVGQPCFQFDDNYWHYDNKLIEDKDIISLECFRSIKLLSLFNLDRNLKYLKIYDEDFELEELSNLINLESLEFGIVFDNENEQIINLNNLKILASSDLSIKLNTPKLKKIQFVDITEIKLDCNPESIKHLITHDYDNKLELFKNLETMELRSVNESMNWTNENILIVFKNLKQLKISFFYSSNYSNEGINNGLIKILNDKMKLRREVDIYLEGVKIVNMDKFNEFKENADSIWKFRLNNYDLLDLNLSFIKNLCYDQLVECVNNIENDLPSNFFDKFQCINWVNVYGGVNDEVNVNVNGLNWFLNNLRYLTTLEITHRSLGQVFYNNLPNTIRKLDIWNTEDINYDFIFKLSKLNWFSTFVDKDLFDLAFSSFSNLKYFYNFFFSFKTSKMSIQKNGKYFYLSDHDNDKIEKLDYNQLIVECNKIRLE